MTPQKNSPDINPLETLTQAIEKVRGVQPTPEPASSPEKVPETRKNQTFLIVGLGNPGKEYTNTRHNIGFMVVDSLAARLGVKFSRLQSRALVTDARHENHKLILAKPQTYMNESGQAVSALMNFYKISPDNILVAFDDMDIPLGALRIRPKGGSGGQKGMKSIIQHLGNTDGFPRLRLGLGRPPGRMDPADFLLQNFSAAEKVILPEMLAKAVDAILTYVDDGLVAAMNQYNASA